MAASGLLLALAICLNLVQSFVVKECFPGGGKCMFTPDTVNCPPNYYCPFYQEYQLSDTSVQEVLDASSCTYSSTNQETTNSTTQYVICPCTPGFYCPEGTELPTYCPEGYYCPSSNATNVDDADGLGSWGSVYHECPEKKFCPTGTIDPFECGSLSKCPTGTVKANKTGYWAVVIFLILVFYILFKISDYISSRERKFQNLEVAREISIAEEATGTNAVVNPTHNNLMSPIVSQDVNTIGINTDSFLIEFNDLSLTLKTGATVMSGVNGKFQPGRLCAIMGASGAGKTTVINLITGKVPRTSGKILVNGDVLPFCSFDYSFI